MSLNRFVCLWIVTPAIKEETSFCSELIVNFEFLKRHLAVSRLPAVTFTSLAQKAPPRRLSLPSTNLAGVRLKSPDGREEAARTRKLAALFLRLLFLVESSRNVGHVPISAGRLNKRT